MRFEAYKEKIKDRLNRYFDVKEKYIYSNTEFDLFAASNIRNERYLASKKLTIYAFENDEYCFMKYLKDVDDNSLQEIIETLKNSIEDYVNPHYEHMSSTITGILVVNELKDAEVIDKVRKFHYQKSFLFGLKGWADIRLVLVDLGFCNVITCKKAKKVSKFYQP